MYMYKYVNYHFSSVYFPVLNFQAFRSYTPQTLPSKYFAHHTPTCSVIGSPLGGTYVNCHLSSTSRVPFIFPLAAFSSNSPCTGLLWASGMRGISAIPKYEACSGSVSSNTKIFRCWKTIFLCWSGILFQKSKKQCTQQSLYAALWYLFGKLWLVYKTGIWLTDWSLYIALPNAGNIIWLTFCLVKISV